MAPRCHPNGRQSPNHALRCDRGAGGQPAIRRGGPFAPFADRLGYDDESLSPPPGHTRRRPGAKSVKFTDYVKEATLEPLGTANIAIVEAAVEIQRRQLLQDQLGEYPRKASPATICRRRSVRRVKDKNIKAIVLRVDSAGRLGHGVRPDLACGKEGTEAPCARGGEHGRRRRVRRLLHLAERQQDHGRARAPSPVRSAC